MDHDLRAARGHRRGTKYWTEGAAQLLTASKSRYVYYILQILMMMMMMLYGPV